MLKERNMDKKVTHRDRILDRVLRKNFIGALVSSKDILPSKVSLFDTTADISIEHSDINKSRLMMDYGDNYYTFDIIYNVRKSEKSKCTQYVICGID